MRLFPVFASAALSLLLVVQPAVTATPDVRAAALDRAESRLAAADPALAAIARADLAAARDVLTMLDDAGDALPTGVAVAHRATALQAVALGVALPAQVATPTYAEPSAAAAAIAAAYGVVVSPAQARELRHLDRLAEPARTALVRLLDAFLGFAGATRVAYAHADPAALAALDRIATTRDLDVAALQTLGTSSPLAAGVDLGPVLRSRLALLDAAAAFHDAGERPGMRANVNLCPALAIDLFQGDDVYTDDCALIVDAVGDDTYLNNAGAGCNSAAALVDFDGVDTYGSGDRCSNGGGNVGAGFLLDTDESDVYTGGLASNGSGGVGAGFLLDTDGDDVYAGTGDTVNGCGTFGAGMLVDVDGADVYTSAESCGNGSAVGGSGVLVDTDGADRYDGPTGTVNAVAAAGAGFLLDADGDDTYTSGGDNANGSGAFGSGFLLDAYGDDTYYADGALVNGSAAGGTGMLVDLRGVDSYTGTGIRANGWGAFGLGLLLDAGGTGDTYVDNLGGSGTDRTVVPKEVVGAQVDVAITG